MVHLSAFIQLEFLRQLLGILGKKNSFMLLMVHQFIQLLDQPCLSLTMFFYAKIHIYQQQKKKVNLWFLVNTSFLINTYPMLQNFIQIHCKLRTKNKYLFIKMGDTEIGWYEEYLLDSREAVIAKLIKGTDSYNYFTFIGLLSKEGLTLSEDQQKQLDQYTTAFKTSRAVNIKTRALFKNYDLVTDKRSQVVEQIKKNFFQNIPFNHTKPAKIKGPGLQSEQLKQKLSQLEEFNTQRYFDEAYSSLESFVKLERHFLFKLDLTKLAESKIEIQEAFLVKIEDLLIGMAFVPEFLKSYQTSKAKIVQNFELYDQLIFQRLSLEQLEKCQLLMPHLGTNLNFVGSLFQKKFKYHVKSTPKKFLTPQEKNDWKQKLGEMYAWAKNLPPLFESLSDQLLYELLQIGIDTNEYDFDLFLNYLKNPKTLYSNCSEGQRQQFQARNKLYQSEWQRFHQLETSRWLSDSSLIEKYLENYFLQNQEISTFDVYLDKKYLVNIKTKIQLYRGEDVAGIAQIFGASVLKQMTEEKLITICKYNKDCFKHGEDVKLFVELKNVSKVTVKIFEFCSENYYLKQKKEIDQSINLDGLIATEESVFQYNEPPIVKKVQEFEFKNITERERGVFIIEFIGNGVSSRAIIRKGRLFLKQKMTVAGHSFQILNENLDVCCGARTGLWLQNRFYEVDQKRQEIIVPFVGQARNDIPVLVHENFAQMVTAQLQKEQYDFRCQYLYNPESMLMSSKTKVLIQPSLYLQNIPVSLKLLSDFQVQVTLTNEADVPSTLTFDNQKLSSSEEIEIQFPMGAKTKYIIIEVTAKVSQLHGKQDENNETEEKFTQNVASNTTIHFDTKQGQNMQ